MPDPTPLVEPVTTEHAIRIVARRVLVAALAGVSAEWENYPGIGEHDWNAVMAEACRLAERNDVPFEQYEAAYRHLAGRAEGVSA